MRGVFLYDSNYQRVTQLLIFIWICVLDSRPTKTAAFETWSWRQLVEDRSAKDKAKNDEVLEMVGE